MLNDRAQALLKALVERYIVEGQPVGSRTLSRHAGLDLSPASIRNVMSDLEELGLVSSPHTSAGRVPTPRGYRLFVDRLLTVQPLELEAHHHITDQLHPDDPQRLVAHASQLLSDLTQFAGVVRMPLRQSAAFRHVEFLRLSERRLLLIVVAQHGEVQNRIILTDRPYSPSQLTEAANFLNQHYAGQDFETVREQVQGELTRLHQDISMLMTTAINLGSEALREQGDDYVLSGEGRLIRGHEQPSSMDTLRKLFGIFEDKTTLLQLLDASQRAQGVSIYIGGESGLMPVDEFSIVSAPYEVDGKVVGTLGVVGPTRMAYERIIPIVDITAKVLSSALSQS
ncbi:MAG: heat-inducible transcriptional repressor HrcA [Pseudomonadota bacterium]|nr:heat-inducible transcriptional repressor HrcA [Pseudomonadota bacterium]